MDAKPWYTSGEMWLNLAALLSLALMLPEVGEIVPTSAVKYVAALNAILNLALRIFGRSTGPITLTRDSAIRKNVGLVLLLALPALGATACATNSRPNVSPEQAHLQQVQRFAVASERAGRIVEQLQNMEIAFYKAGRVTREDHRVFQLSAKIAAETMINALEQMKDPAQTEITRRQWASVALGAVDRLVNEALIPIADPQARLELQLLSTAITSILMTLQLTANASPPDVPWQYVLERPSPATFPIGGLAWLA